MTQAPPYRRLIALATLALTMACTGATDDPTAANTEINLDIVNPGGTSAELGFTIDRVDYRITCASSSNILPPFVTSPAPPGGPCSTADVDNNGIPDVCPPGSNYIQGTSGPDNITATNAPDCIFGFGGNDVIMGGNQNDYVCGGSGDDNLDGGNGDNRLFGEGGNDILIGHNGSDVLDGGEGDDTLLGGNSTDSLIGGPGIDTLDGENGEDTCVEEVPGTNIRLTSCENGYSDAVDISGAFEVVDTRIPPVWQAVMDLPPGDCTITLSVYEDDEVVCVGSQTLAIVEDGTTKYDIVLVCSLSVDLPDGMADVDGTFEFITGNLCPKLYVLNAIPEIVDFAAPNPGTEIQYRAKDPDNTCGNNCDPQTCDFSNPPVCTPYPSNINDPACNPAAGGDPNSVDCQAGVYAGLVCNIVAIPSASGLPGGTFLSPIDGVTPVGPILPVNLNTASGIPGVILPGMGGPAGTNAENSPAYPPLPNVNGSLPALRYQCDVTQPGPALISLTCSDGDTECDQSKQITVQCPGKNCCVSDPVDCSATGECLTDGVCDPFCDPSDPGCTNRCPGQDLPVPDGTICSIGSCLGGVCVECTTDADCATNPAPPVDCQLPNTCVANSCVAGGVAPSGTTCSNGLCDGSGTGSTSPPCNFVACDPCESDCGQTPLSCQNVLGMGCTNNVTSDISILPFQLDANPEPVLTGAVTNIVFGGIAEFSEVFLDAAQGAVPGGVTQADLINLAATTLIRTGGTGGSVVLTNAPIPATCLIGATPCNPANDGASVPGQQPNSDCVPVGTFNPCQQIVLLPTSSDCSVGGTCDLIGKGPGTSQCDVNGFCVTSGLPLPLVPQATTFTAGASGIVNFGFDDVNTGATPLNPDGTYDLPGAVFTDPQTPNEIKVNAGGLSVALACTMAVDSGGPDGVGVPDQASPTPTANLSTFNIQVP